MIKEILVCDRCGKELKECYYEAVVEMHFKNSKLGNINGSYCFSCFKDEITKLNFDEREMEHQLLQMEGKIL